MKLIKWAFYLIVVTLLLVVVAGVFIVNKVDPNDYKDKIAAQVKAHTGRVLTIDGDLNWSFYPSLGFEVGSLSLDNRAGFAPEKMLSAQGAKVHVAVLPLIQKKLEVGSVVLEQPVLNLTVNQQGVSNWGDLVSPAADVGATQKSNTPSQSGALLGGLIVKGVKIANGQVNWHDQMAEQQLNVSQFNLKMGEIAPGQVVSFSLDASLEGNVVAHRTQITGSGSLQVSESLDAARLSGLRVSFTQHQLDADIDLGVLDYQANNQKLQAQAILFEGRYDVIPLQGEIAQLDFDLNQNLLTTGKQNYEIEVLGVKSNINVASLSLSVAEQRLDLPAVSITQGEAKINLSTQISNLFSKLKARGSITTNVLKINELLPALTGIALDDFPDSALRELQIKSNYQATLDSISLPKLTARIDQSNITGSFSMKSFSSPAYRFQLAVDQLNADNYISETNQQAAAQAEPAAQTGPADVVALPFAALKGLDVKGLLKIADFQYQGLQSNNLVVDVDTHADSITLAPLKANLYGGVSINDITYDISGDRPKMNFKTKLENIKLSPFLQAMQLGDRFAGLGNVKANVNSVGLTVAELISNMNGEVRINLEDGAIKGVNIQKSLIDVAAAYKRLKGKDVVSSTEVGDKTEFSNFSALVKVRNGVLLSDNIDLQAPAIRLKGSGNVDLNTENLDLKMVVAIVNTLEGQGGQSFNELQGEELPLTISGNLAAPKVRIDTVALLKKQLKKGLAKEITKKYGTSIEAETGEEVAPEEALKTKLKGEKAKLKQQLLKGLLGG